MSKGFLVLETGEVFSGTLIGSQEEASGEVVFNTSMTGFQEMLTDPGYAGQILTFCYPIVGNCGINSAQLDNEQIHLAGVVMGEVCEQPSHYQADKSVAEHLMEAGVSGICGIDTRALVKTIRERGTVQGIITSSLEEAEQDRAWQKSDYRLGAHRSWVEKVVSTKERAYHPIESTGHTPHVVLIDFGVKQSLINSLVNEGCRVTVVPYFYSYEQIKRLSPQGVLLSSGPGDPIALTPYLSEIKQISRAFPTLGIGLGHQLLALAYGMETKKLRCGHRGSNHPVKEVSTGKVLMTAQNHGYTLIEESIDPAQFEVTYYHVNDGSIEGLKHTSLPITTVQFHPEGHPGPSDGAHIFTQFVQQIQIGDMDYALTQ